MSDIKSRRANVTLVWCTLVGCGLVFLAARVNRDQARTDPQDVLWKIPGPAQQVAFSPDGARVTLLGTNCQILDAKSGRVLSSWTPAASGQLTPDGQSLISLDWGKATAPLKIQQTWKAEASPSPGQPFTKRTHSRLILTRLFKGRFLNSFDARTGELQWKAALPDDTKRRIYSPAEICGLSNRYVFLNFSRSRSATDKWQETIFCLSRQSGKSLRSFSSAVETSRFGMGTFLFNRSGHLLYQPSDAAAKSATLELREKPGTPSRFFAVLPHTKRGYAWFPLVFDPAERFLAGSRMAGRNTYIEEDDEVGRIYLWNAAGKLLWTNRPANFTAQTLAFSPDGRFLAVGGTVWNQKLSGQSGRLMIFEVATGALFKELDETNWLSKATSSIGSLTNGKTPAGTGPVESISWSLDGRSLGATYRTAGFKMWKVG